ncbi:putative reverse transcriptase domain-containing protein [Tanacetum coccineum]
MSMTIQSSVKDKILVAQSKVSKVENATTEMLRGRDQQMEKKDDGGLYFIDRGWDSIDRYALVAMYEEGYSYLSLQLSDMFKDIAESLKNTFRYVYGLSSSKDGQSECTIQTLEDILRACVIVFGGSLDTHLPLAELSYNNRRVPLKRLEIAKGYADNRRKPLEFKVGD